MFPAKYEYEINVYMFSCVFARITEAATAMGMLLAVCTTDVPKVSTPMGNEEPIVIAIA